MAELSIKGHPTRGEEVIKLLEMLGGNNKYNFRGDEDEWFVLNGNIQRSDRLFDEKGFTLEEFLKKYPYKVGDEVEYKSIGDANLKSKIIYMEWCNALNKVLYTTEESHVISTEDIIETNQHPKTQAEVDKYLQEHSVKNVMSVIDIETCLEIDGLKLPENVVINSKGIGSIQFTEWYEKSQYPKTYDECCEVLGYTEALGYAVDDIIFIKDTGWIRITKKLWDCYAEEHVYEGIDIINGHEYKDIRHQNVTAKLQLGHLKHCKDVDDVRYVNSIADDIMISQITNKVSVIKFKPDVCDNEIELHLGDYEIEVRDGKTYAVKKKSKYPKTYKECCDVLGLNTMDNDAQGYKADLIIRFQELIIARNAYWKIAGEELGLDKPWEPDWKDSSQQKFTIFYYQDEVSLSKGPNVNRFLSFPTEEMRDIFYENFKNLIENCKKNIII